MLQSIRNQQVIVTLRNDTLVKGTILDVDANMNIELKDAMLEPDLFYCTKLAKVHIQQQAPSKIIDDCESDMDNLADGATSCPFIKIEEKEEPVASDSDGNEQISRSFDYFVVKGTRIRHIDLPTDCDLVASAKSEIERIRSRRKQWTKRDIVRSSKYLQDT